MKKGVLLLKSVILSVMFLMLGGGVSAKITQSKTDGASVPSYPARIIADCRSLGFTRDESIDCASVLASLDDPGTEIAFSIPLVQEVDPSCPPLTQLNEDGECVLEADTVLTKTLLLSSGTTLNCKGHRLTPTVDGIAGVPWEPPYPKPSVPSVPNTAVLLAGNTSGVTVKNCVIANFDFGIVIANSKVPPAAKRASRNIITGNTLNNRYRGVQIIASDRNNIEDNKIDTFSFSSGGVGIFHDSDDNLVRGNTYVGPNPEWWTPGPSFPGGADEVGTAMEWSGEGVRVIGPTVSYNFRVGNRMLVGTRNPNGWAERNRIEENDITTSSRAIDSDSLTDGTVIRHNFLHDVGEGIGLLNHFYGHDNSSRNALVEGNTVLSSVEAGVLIAFTENPVVRGNTFMNGGVGIFLGGDGLATATITKNLVKDSEIGFFLFECCGQTPATFGAKVSLNDFVGNALAVLGEVEAPVELSVDGKGNYWGHDSCPGFLPSDSSNPDLIKDSFPYIGPVADAESPPDQCE